MQQIQQLILQFFQRFRNDITDSIYTLKTFQDYQKLKTYYDYLDFNKQTIYKSKTNPMPCGLRNIGNTCYLNVFLQILFQICSLRQKIFAHDFPKSKILSQLKYLFGRMQLGKLAYADPTFLFNQLKISNPKVFVQGVQNDFHQICTILVDQLKQGFKNLSQNQTKIIQKILFGKVCVKTSHSEGKNVRNTRFSIINLDVCHEDLEKALQRWKKYEIQDYMSQNNKMVKALVQTEFIETPALLTFFINRVKYSENRLIKDNRQFKYKDLIQIEKSSAKEKNENKRQRIKSVKEQQLLEEKGKLTLWIQKIKSQKQILKSTLKYLQEKQFTNINVPQIQNKYQQNSKVKQYLEEQIRLISIKITDAQNQVLNIQNKNNQLYQQNQIELYHLWGMMIHEGSTPTSGHYKVLLQIDNKWFQFNDNKVEIISQQKIHSFNKKGQVCCLFYKRPTLVCSDKKVPITGSLKNKVNQIQKQVTLQIDKARILQNLYQLTQSSGFLVQQQMHNYKNNNQWDYFFKPIIHCFQQKYSFNQCQGLLTYENLKEPTNILKLQNSFLTNLVLQIPQLSLQIPTEYFKYAQVFKTFIKKELSIECIDDSYQWLGQNINIPIKNKTVLKWTQKYLQVFIMKGVFYLSVLYRTTLNPFIQSKFSKLFKALEKIMKKLNSTSQFILTYIPIKDELQKLISKKMNDKYSDKSQKILALKPTSNAIISKVMCQSISSIFKQRFQYWVIKRSKISQIDESIINKEEELQKNYIIQVA